MKARKTIKRLGRVEALLETVIDQYDECTRKVDNLLNTARSSVASAHQALAIGNANRTPKDILQHGNTVPSVGS
jgi:hypothetical protein